MRIVVLLGSPRRINSTTLQYAVYLQKKFPEHEFELVDACHDFEHLPDGETLFNGIIAKVRAADAVLWAYPVFNLLVHAHYKQFIEWILARGAAEAFRDKYTASLSTSVHYFDNLSHSYVQAICDDLGMKYVGAYSAFTYDLLKKEEKNRLMLFAEEFFQAATKRLAIPRVYEPVRYQPFDYRPGATAAPGHDLRARRMLILTDSPDDDNCARMVARFRSRFTPTPEVINLRTGALVRSDCTGCFECCGSGHCTFRDTDDVEAIYLSKVAPADVIVIAGKVHDRYLSSHWKLFLDRGFFHPLVPWFPGKQVAVLLSGPLRQLANLRQTFEGYIEYHQGNLVGIVTDEYQQSADLDAAIDALAERLTFCLHSGYSRPRTFLGVGASKIFRDATWGFLRPVFQVADRYFRRHGMYDFPQYEWKTRLMVIGGSIITRIPGVRAGFFKSLKTEIAKCLQKEVRKDDTPRPNRGSGGG